MHEPALRPGPGAHQDLAVVEQVQLSRELPWAMNDEHPLGSVGVEVEDLDAAALHEKEVDAALPPPKQRCFCRRLFLRAECCDSAHLLFAQDGVALGLPRIGVRCVEGCRHYDRPGHRLTLPAASVLGEGIIGVAVEPALPGLGRSNFGDESQQSVTPQV